MIASQLMCKIWDGDANEYFTWLDMNRVEYNLNLLAEEVGVPTVEFIETTHASQFRWDEAQKVEALLASIASEMGIAVPVDDGWSEGHSVSYVDFERWESGFWSLYKALGGLGERIPADKVLVTYHATLFASAWRGTGPYWQELDMPSVIDEDVEALAYIAHTATVEQRSAEASAGLYVRGRSGAQTVSDRKVRIVAPGVVPKVDLPLRLSIGGLSMHQEITLSASAWSGSGPWTQTVTLSSSPINAVIGAWEGMSNAAVEAMTEAMISVSALSGTTATIRAIGTKPTIAINPIVMWETTEMV